MWDLFLKDSRLSVSGVYTSHFLFSPLQSGLMPINLQKPWNCSYKWLWPLVIYCTSLLHLILSSFSPWHTILYMPSYHHVLMSPSPSSLWPALVFLPGFLFFCLSHLMAFLQLYSCCASLSVFVCFLLKSCILMGSFPFIFWSLPKYSCLWSLSLFL